MKKKYGLKTVVASILVTAALVSPAVVLSSTPDPLQAELIFRSSATTALSFMDDGSVQLLVDVAVDKTVNCRGASFHLRYNRDYLEPSYIADTTVSGVTHKANSVISGNGIQSTDGFFRQDKNIFGEVDGSNKPIRVYKDQNISLTTYRQEYYSHVDPSAGTIDMTLWFDNQSIAAAVASAEAKIEAGTRTDPVAMGELALLSSTTMDDEEKVYVFNKEDADTDTNQDPTDGPVVLGQLSFRVKKDRLPEIIDLFGGLDVLSDYRDPANPPKRPFVDVTAPNGVKSGTTYLLDINHPGLSWNEDPWQIGYYSGEEGDLTHHYYGPGHTNESGVPTSKATNVAEHYIFDFNGDLIVDVSLTNPDFEINAYQNYTTGVVNDLKLSMGRYANMVTVTYANGTKENKPFPWGYPGSSYTAKYVKAADLDPAKTWAQRTATAISPYDPTANVANPGVGTDYVFTQKYQIYKTDPATGEYLKRTDGSGLYQVAYTFPIPVTGHMRVTPITVLDVTAENMTKTYPVGDVLTDIQTTSDLQLPTQARIITDIVPGNVSLVTPIKGWTPVQPKCWSPGDAPDSTWPTGVGGTAMNSLKAVYYVRPDTDPTTDPTGLVEGYPYWPDVADRFAVDASNPAYAPDHFVGDYPFATAVTNGGAAQDILKADIQASFPWLTVPKDSYSVGQALRRIVKPEDYVRAKDYTVSYVQTVTKTAGGDANGVGQPTLTLSVERLDNTDMATDSVFRVWLPNGLELGTGQAKGGVTVDNWFNDPAATPASATHVNGFYETEPQFTATSRRFFQLHTNPSDPLLPVSTATADYHNQQRETLRRYINLGGWYYVAICENPADAAPKWTDPIPVYVPPRRNEYQESKIYNFIAENAGLFNWPGALGSTMAFPKGIYNVVGPEASDVSGWYIGLPLYAYKDAGGVITGITNGIADANAVFENGNRYLPRLDRYTEAYGVETTYNGQTGAQPGMIHSVKVDIYNVANDADWTLPTATETLHASVDPGQKATPATTTSVTKNGSTPLEDGYLIPGYGYVYQPDGAPNTYRATLRRQLPEEPAQLREKVTLTSTADDGIHRTPPGTKADNVELVTFNTVTEGYTVRQDHLLTINNVGDVDIYGLNIDSLIDGYNLKDNATGTAPEGGHFEITVPPADFLPAGSSTNFVLTYVYDLRANSARNGFTYHDNLFITSTSHPEPGVGKDYLIKFEAELTVTEDPLHQVTVIYNPDNGTMGTAGLIVGEQNDGTKDFMNVTPTTRTYPQDGKVYVAVYLEDEYAVKKITLTDSAGNKVLDNNGNEVQITAYGGTADVSDDMLVYTFVMPNQDVVVTVDFYEPITSKLRLDDLIEFSAPPATAPATRDLVEGYDATGVYEPNDKAEHIYKVWKKQFSGAAAKGTTAASGDYKDASTWSGNHGNADEDYFLMTRGSAISKANGGDVYNSSNKHYLVVIDAEDDFSQVKATLRNVKYHEDYQGKPKPTDPVYSISPDGFNLDIKPTVNMTLYYKDDVLDKWTSTAASDPVYDPDHGYGPYDATTPPPTNLRPQGDTVKSTQHLTDVFISPDPGESAYVHIEVSYNGGTAETTGTRHYYVEIHRRTAQPEVVLHYGNAPYGMIMNEDKFISTPVSNSASDIQDAKDQTEKTRTAAKTAFRKGYTFRGADASVLPDAVAGKLQNVTYWREAWARNLAVFEPESLRGYYPAKEGDRSQKFSDTAKTQPIYLPDPNVYKESDNLDLNDYAFFAILGEDMWEPGVISAKDSSGREVSLYDITAYGMDIDDVKGVTLLDTTKTSQVDRFSGAKTEILDLGVAGQKLTALTEHSLTPVTVATDSVLGVTQWPAKTTVTVTTPAGGGDPVTTITHSVVEDIRPGRYVIQYRYLDYDGVTVLKVDRPFVILRRVGDVNVDGVRDAISHFAAGNSATKNDEYAIENRVTHDPLGYEAGGWDAANKKETVYPYANIFKFRVADVNNDRNINNIDANQAAKNAKDAAATPSVDRWLRFYDPLDYGHPGAPMTAPSP